MGITEEHGHDTNIVFGSENFGSVHGAGILDDPWEPDSQRRYKALYFYVPPTIDEVGGGLVKLAYSPDGKQWSPSANTPVVGPERTQLDDVAIITPEPESRGYLAFTRHPFMSGGPTHVRMPPHGPTGGTPTYDLATDMPQRRNRRRIFLMESSDFKHWSAPRLVLAPDSEIDNLDTAFYGMKAHRIGNQWLGFLNILNMVSNTMHVELTHSRDGRTWRRVAPGRAWLAPGDPGDWDQFMVNITSSPIEPNDRELNVYFGGARNHHDWWFAGPTENRDDPSRWDHAPEVNDMAEVSYCLGLATMRRDGFVSLGASLEREGIIVTEPFVAPGNTLVINASCKKGGYVKVEVTDWQDQPVPGGREDQCDIFDGDAIEHIVTWHGNQSMPMPKPTSDDIRLPETPYRRLRFTLRGAELYSFRIAHS